MSALRILTAAYSLILMCSFIRFYSKETNETLKLKFKKKETVKSIYKIKNIYRCHHETQYEGQPEILRQFSSKILSNGLETRAVTFK